MFRLADAMLLFMIAFVALLARPGVLAEPAGASAPVDLSGRVVDPLGESGAKLVVLVFVRTDCPLANRYAPEVQRLHASFAPRGVVFWLVYPDPAEDAETIRGHLKEYRYRIGALRDPGHTLVQKSRVTVTPEAAVFDAAGQLLFHGRIDDRYPALGQARAAPTTRDLEAALEAALDGHPLRRETVPAVGCFLSDLR
jgi:hypothetical protein